MATIKQFEDLDSWKKSRTLCDEIFKHCAIKPFASDFELKNQIIRSSGSIMDNIAEGFERGSKGEFITFLGYAKGSAGEVRSQLYRAKDRNYLSEKEFDVLFKEITDISKMLSGFITYLNNANVRGERHKSTLNIKPKTLN